MPWRSLAPLVEMRKPGAGEVADHGRTGPARRGVHGDADGLVDHHDGVVVVDDPDALDDLGLHLERVTLGRDRHVEHRTAVDPVALADGRPVDVHQALGDQVGGLGAGEAEHPRHRGVDALAGQTVGDEDRALLGVGGHAASCPESRSELAGAVEGEPAERLQDDQAGSDVDADVGDVEDRPVGQHQEVDDVAVERLRLAHDAVGEVAGNAAQQQAEGQRPADAADPAAQPEHDHDRDHRQAGEDDGEARCRC